MPKFDAAISDHNFLHHNHPKISPCYQPSSEDAERMLELDGLSPDELHNKLERDADQRGLVLCPDWWEKLQADIAGKES